MNPSSADNVLSVGTPEDPAAIVIHTHVPAADAAHASAQLVDSYKEILAVLTCVIRRYGPIQIDPIELDALPYGRCFLDVRVDGAGRRTYTTSE